MLRIRYILLFISIPFLLTSCFAQENNSHSDQIETTLIPDETTEFVKTATETQTDFEADGSFSEIKREVLKFSNIYRKSQRRSILSVKSELNKIAQKHSNDMAAGKVDFSHAGFQQRFNAVKKYASFPVSVAENLYATTDPQGVGEEAVKAWIKSPGHKKNLRGKFKFSGIGVSKSSSGEFFVVQLYVGKSNKK